MRRPLILSAVIGIGSAALFAGTAFAGGWGCGHCGVYPQAEITYAPPTYSYAPPTYTIVPHYVVQPNVIVERTYVIPQTQYLREPAPCLFACGGRYVVNQGQYAEPGLVAPAALQSYPGYAPSNYPSYRHRYYNRGYYGPHVYRGYGNVGWRGHRYAVTPVHVNRHAVYRGYRRTH
jgi:hypothetical protein